ncbi:MobF family relaxase [Bosea sp. AAP35]|uniref:MobF family relaxase n=1 Tax=Bosea sp. AAP35 TaxID=1523417 RepID=UPI0006B9C64E|nr:MobF family relaxase [Bosea sp. AAP35]
MTIKPNPIGHGGDAANYYTKDSLREARPDRRDEYYAKDGAGIWWSTGESIVRHGAAIDAQSFRDLCAGIDPATGQPLVRGAGPTHVAGIDLTGTVGKSVSVLWAAGNSQQRAVIEAAHRKAIDEALQLMLDEGLVVVRSGAGGTVKHQPSDMIVAKFEHFTTREGDPNLHSHCVLLNVAGSAKEPRSGRYRTKHLTTDPAAVFAWQRTLGANYRASLARELKQAYGFTFREAGQGQWEIEGVDPKVLAAFSKRSAQIVDYAGPNATSAQREIAALATRKGKDQVPTGAELEARWQQELAALAADPWRDAMRPVRETEHAVDREDRDFDPPEVKGDGAVARAASELFSHESVIERRTLLQRAFEVASLDGQGPDIVMAELDVLERDGTLVALGSEERSMRWTTPAIAQSEAAMLRAASRPDEREWITSEAINTSLALAPNLTVEQQDAARELTGRDGVTIVEAGAGTGKTTMANVVVEAARRSGLEIVGLAPSWVAADALAESTGIPAQAIARWRYDRASGVAPQLSPSSLLIVDEAGMVGTRDMAAILTAAQEAGTKVLLLGDRRQLPSVSGASALRAVSNVIERSAIMTEVKRQRVDWQRAATVAMAQGDSETGLRAYAMNDRLDLVSGAQAAQDRVIEQWQSLRAQYGDDVIIITGRNDDAVALNQKARKALRAEGKLGIDLVELPALNRSGEKTKLALAIGDHLRFGETLPQHGIRNGHQATVDGVMRDHDGLVILRLSLQDGRKLMLPWNELAREPRFGRKPTLPRIVHAIAGTAYAAQGRTCSASVLYVAKATDAREVYVGMSRHCHDARIVVERERLDALCRQRQADPRRHASADAIRDKLFEESTRYREKANVIDYADDAQEFMNDGQIRRRHGQLESATTRVLKAVRLLENALIRLGHGRLPTAWLGLSLREDRVNLPAKSQNLLTKVRINLTHKAMTRADRAPSYDR